MRIRIAAPILLASFTVMVIGISFAKAQQEPEPPQQPGDQVTPPAPIRPGIPVRPPRIRPPLKRPPRPNEGPSPTAPDTTPDVDGTGPRPRITPDQGPAIVPGNDITTPPTNIQE